MLRIANMLNLACKTISKKLRKNIVTQIDYNKKKIN